MILSDRDIKKYVTSGDIEVGPVKEDGTVDNSYIHQDGILQPASVDLHLHNEFRIFPSHQLEYIDPKQRPSMEEELVEDGKFFVLQSGAFALGLVREVTGVSDKFVGRLEGKSSLARLGLLIHTTAGFLDPGNRLRLTLELYNASPVPMRLWPGMKVAQIAFEELSSPCERPYGSAELGSKYRDVLHIQSSEMYKNFKP